MMKIITLTPNPALDISGHVRELLRNEKNYIHDERRDPGGNGINSARIATRLMRKQFRNTHKVQIIATGLLGGQAGDEIKKLLRREKVTARFVPIRGFTRANVTVTEDKTGQQTRLTFPGPKISPAESRALIQLLHKQKGPGIFLLGGSLPNGCDSDYHASLARAAQSQNFGVIADVPARNLKTLFSKLKAPLLMIKPNQNELEEWVGRKLSADKDLAKASQSLTGHAKLVCVSLADRGAMITFRNRTWFAHAPEVKARGTVGAGDSMVGAVTLSLVQSGIVSTETLEQTFKVAGARDLSEDLPAPVAEAFQWGLAAGAATAGAVGTSLADPREISRLKPLVHFHSF